LEVNYYILPNVYTTEKEGLKPGERIFKIQSYIIFDFKKGEGPFSTIDELKKGSTIFKKLQNENGKRAQQIFEEKNICHVRGFAFHEEGHNISKELLKILDHTLKGNIKNNKITGVHYYDPNRVKILKPLKFNKSTQILKAEIAFFNPKTKEWIKKDSPTTLFPISWSEHQLVHECEYALNNMKKKEGTESVFFSKTLSGISVEIIKKGSEVKSIYPIL
tara:strand:+ start:465 stop:1121 length:657 start_codon:yes stop_codon:yes gene_type:complete